MLLFNQVNLGGNISLIWLLISLFPLVKQRLQYKKDFLFLNVFLLAILLKFFALENYSAVFRYIVYVVTLCAILFSFEKRDFQYFFQGFEVGLGINVCFASVQMLGELTGAYHALLKPATWNPYLWHSNPPGGMFTFWPRVSGFTNEPAYLGLLFIANATYRIFVSGKKTVTGRYGLYLLLVMLLLVNSRTAFYAYIFLAFGAALLRFRDQPAIKPVAITLYIVSFVVMPAYIIHNTSDFRSAQEMLRQDVSVFARAVPLRWPLTPEYFSLSQYAFGVSDYSEFSQNLPIPIAVREMFVRQGMFSDSKSLGGAYFYDLGIIGTALYIIGLGIAYRWRVRPLLLYAVLNVGFFNVYAFSWPLFWICVVAGAVAPALSKKEMNGSIVSFDGKVPQRPPDQGFSEQWIGTRRLGRFEL